jgi:transcriptional regulator with XRE-family HTH domain
MRTIRDTTADNIRTLRRSRGMTQRGLATRVNQLGARIDRTAVAKIESGRRELTLPELFQFAWALDVAPVHLLVPADSTEPIDIGPNMQASPHEVRAWIRGQLPLFQDARIYYSAVPKSEFEATQHRLAEFQRTAPIIVTTNPREDES